MPPSDLCRQHLLGEHRELHALWSIITKNKKAYSKHPETLRWKGKLHALHLRHETLVSEMQKRGYNHNSPLDPLLATGESRQDILITSIDEQKDALRKKGCDCKI